MCACEPGFTCARCEPRARTDAAVEHGDEALEEMIGAAGWEDRWVPALADFEAKP
jgi:hypothetical protein